MTVYQSIRRYAMSAALVLACCMPAPSMAKEVLVLSSWLPPKHPIVTDAIKPWAREIAKATEGRVKIRVLAKPLGSVQAHYDLAVEGIADITYGVHSYGADARFQRSRFGQFSFIGETARQTSKAYWQVYARQLDAEKDHPGTKLLSLFVHGPGLFFNNRKVIQSAADFAGLKIRTPGGYVASLVSDLGATTQFMAPSEVFEKLSRGVIDGVTFPVEGVRAYKLTKHLKHIMRLPGGLYNTSWFLVMNETKWQRLSAKDQKAIMALSGEAFAARAGQVWDDLDKKAWAVINKSDMRVQKTPDDVVDTIKSIAGTYEAAWVKMVKAGGYDGKKALAAFRTLSTAR